MIARAKPQNRMSVAHRRGARRVLESEHVEERLRDHYAGRPNAHATHMKVRFAHLLGLDLVGTLKGYGQLSGQPSCRQLAALLLCEVLQRVSADPAFSRILGGGKPARERKRPPAPPNTAQRPGHAFLDEIALVARGRLNQLQGC